MNLYTSSSKLYISLSAGVLLLLVYNLILFVSPPSITEFQNQWIKNFAFAERYIYLDQAPEVVLVGSSMAARLDADMVYPGARNLSFASTGAMTGLEVIQRSGHYPKLVLVESNMLETASDSEMIASLFTPVYWKLKRMLRFLQYQYQPGNILMTWITNKFGQPESAKAEKKPAEKTLRDEIKRKVLSLSNDSRVRSADYSLLRQTLADLAKRGTQVVLFRMPIAPELIVSPVYQLREERVSQEFAEYPFFTMTAEEAVLYQTNDGRHLNSASAKAFSKVLSRHISALFP